ncbi:MAG TPA: alpha-amylase family glycosyl hydrolase [Chloroflexia bacterium]|jgi:alpha-glucosidase
MEERYLWWQRGTIYQIYPRSFMDSNGDGVGDLPGILARLDYLEWLGIDAVWLSPIYPSPMADFGYDVADYTGIEPLFGTMDDFDRLLAEVHRRGMKLLLDLVPNHTSNEHPWFIESRSSRDNPKRDWYIWRDPAPGGGPPNNWLSVFGGSAWEWDEPTGQYYLHSFAVEQPELDWRNPEVEAAVFDATRFWLDKGVDGFRVDVIYYLLKDELFRDNPPDPDFEPGQDEYRSQMQVYTFNHPEVHAIIRRMRKLFDEYDDRVMIGEIYLPQSELMLYYGHDNDEAHLPFNFQLILLPWNADIIRAAVSSYEATLPPQGWPNWVLGNHDNHRIATRVGRAQARVANMLLLTLRGTPTCYYGDELAMVDVEIPPDMVQDVQELGKPGLGLGRDPERTPMQWGSSPHAGFTMGQPWLPVAPDYKLYNVATERDDPNSMLTFVRQLLALRRSSPALSVGGYTDIPAEEPDIFSFMREHGGQRMLVVLNFSHDPCVFKMRSESAVAEIALSTVPGRSGQVDLANLTLAPDEGIIVRLMEP